MKDRKNAFLYAFAGIGEAWRREAHLRIHAGAIALVILCGLHFNISAWEWVAVVLCCALVVILELINTALESLCDIVMPRPHPEIGYIKDISAAAVLLACLAAVVVGSIVFLPRFFQSMS